MKVVRRNMAKMKKNAHLIGSTVSKHGDRNMFAGNWADFHIAMLMIFCS